MSLFRHQLPIERVAGRNISHGLNLLFDPKIYDKNNNCVQEVSSETINRHFDAVCSLIAPQDSYYPHAYQRWEKYCQSNKDAKNGAYSEFTLQHRALIGLSDPSLWNTNITLHSTYGVPYIPGTALKGLAKHYALSLKHQKDNDGLVISDQQISVLFDSDIAAHAVRFHNAWWVPNSGLGSQAGDQQRPLVREGINPHHSKFKPDGSGVPSPTDSTVPVPQIGTHGKFLVAVSGASAWAEVALYLLQLALEREGVGARTPEYGKGAM
jgi:CRISPR-associated protein Cmr6